MMAGPRIKSFLRTVIALIASFAAGVGLARYIGGSMNRLKMVLLQRLSFHSQWAVWHPTTGSIYRTFRKLEDAEECVENLQTSSRRSYTIRRIIIHD